MRTLSNEQSPNMLKLPEDNPINRATLLDLDLPKQREYIAKLQERRLRIHEMPTKARETAARIRSEPKKVLQANDLEKKAEKLEKVLSKIEIDLNKAEKLADEIKVYRMVEGDYE